MRVIRHQAIVIYLQQWTKILASWKQLRFRGCQYRTRPANHRDFQKLLPQYDKYFSCSGSSYEVEG